jgi:hypothetical protein
MKDRPWPWRRRADRYNPAMTTLLTAALPLGTAAPVHPSAHPSTVSSIGLPTGLTEADTERITAAISAARTEATRTVYAHAWRGWERWCAARGIPALPGDPLALCMDVDERTLSAVCRGLSPVAGRPGRPRSFADQTFRESDQHQRAAPALGALCLVRPCSGFQAPSLKEAQYLAGGCRCRWLPSGLPQFARTAGGRLRSAPVEVARWLAPGLRCRGRRAVGACEPRCALRPAGRLLRTRRCTPSVSSRRHRRGRVAQRRSADRHPH